MSGDNDAPGVLTPQTERAFRDLLEMLSKTYNFDFREYKEASLARRIKARMAQVRIDGFAAYVEFVTQHQDEHVALFNTILINVTGFFRDPEAWNVLKTDVIPRIVEDASESRSIRIWSAGCSSGEEPYSVAMLLADYLRERASNYLIKIYGTDVDEDALNTARHGLYRLDQLKEMPSEALDRHFTRDGQLYRFRRDLRRWCIFGAHNLIQAPPLSHIDLLLCRNVLIYFTSDLQDRVLARFHYANREDGYLFLGRSESLLARSRLYTPRNLKWRIFQRMPTTARQVAAVLPDREAPAIGAPGAHSTRADALSQSRAQRALEALPAAAMVIDMADTILTWNPGAEQLFDIPTGNALARKFRDLDVSYRVEGLRARIEEVKARHTALRMENTTFARRDGTPVHADIAISPLFEGTHLLGVVVFGVEATEYARLKEQMTRVAEQHATAIEELQSTNEELETTNEELQSTNEELETTNEELQSTNEELETTVEELQAANAELGTLNNELESRTAELNRVDGRHQSIINSLEQGVVVLDRDNVIRIWNRAAERMWGFQAEHALGHDFFSLPNSTISQLPRAPFARILNGALHEDISEQVHLAAGTQVGLARLRLTPLKEATGEVTGVVAIFYPDASDSPTSS